MFYNILYKIRCYDSVVVLKSIKKFLVSVIILLCVKRKLMLNAIGNFISNNVGGIHSSEKRLKIFKYLKNNIHHKGFAFLRETGSLTEDEKKRKNDFKDPLFFLHGSTKFLWSSH